MITLYAITDHPTPPIPSLGAMRVVTSGDLAAVCGPVLEGEVTAEALWRHERLVEALMADRDVLPVRYGTCLPDDAAAVRTLDDNRAEFVASLEAVRGAAELAVRVFAGADAIQARDAGTDDAQGRDAGADDAGRPAASQRMTGTAYLRARARVAADESGAAAIVHEPLARAARAATLARVNRPGELMRAAYLVDRDAAGAFSDRVRIIQEESPQLRVTCTGPWPPYSFAKR